MIGRRDRDTLNMLYPSTNTQFISMRVEVSGVTVGWAVLLATDMRAHKYFGDLRVGSIVDCLAVPGHAAGVVRGGRAMSSRSRRRSHCLESDGRRVGGGLKSNGFMPGPSTFLFGASKTLAKLLRSDEGLQGGHLNRGDGDGPINL